MCKRCSTKGQDVKRLVKRTTDINDGGRGKGESRGFACNDEQGLVQDVMEVVRMTLRLKVKMVLGRKV